MRKQELVHFHRLLVEIRWYLAEQEEIEIPAGAFDTYEDCEVKPTALTERKAAHEEAVDHLLEGLQTTVAAQRTTADTRPNLSGSVSASPSR